MIFGNIFFVYIVLHGSKIFGNLLGFCDFAVNFFFSENFIKSEKFSFWKHKSMIFFENMIFLRNNFGREKLAFEMIFREPNFDLNRKRRNIFEFANRYNSAQWSHRFQMAELDQNQEINPNYDDIAQQFETEYEAKSNKTNSQVGKVRHRHLPQLFPLKSAFHRHNHFCTKLCREFPKKKKSCQAQ